MRRSAIEILSLSLVAALMLPPGSDAAAQTIPEGVAIPVTYSQNYDPSLSPDGSRMVFLKALEGREQLFIADSDGSNEQRLLGPDGVDIEDPAWSPDGRMIAYIRIVGSSKSMHVMNTDGSDDRVVTPTGQSPIHPAWMPDSRSILYCTDDDLRPPQKNAAEIYRIDIARRKITTLVSGGVNTYPVPSPDGARIALGRCSTPIARSSSPISTGRASKTSPTIRPSTDGPHGRLTGRGSRSRATATPPTRFS